MPAKKAALVDRETRDARVLQYIRLIHYMVRKLQNNPEYHFIRRMDYDDAVQVGTLALMRAAELYNPDHPSKAGEKSYYAAAITQWLVREANRYQVVHPADHEYREIRKNGETLADVLSMQEINRRGSGDESGQQWEPEDPETVPALVSYRNALSDVGAGLEQLEPEELLLVRSHFRLGVVQRSREQLAELLGVSTYTVTDWTKKAIRKLRKIVLDNRKTGSCRRNYKRRGAVKRLKALKKGNGT